MRNRPRVIFWDFVCARGAGRTQKLQLSALYTSPLEIQCVPALGMLCLMPEPYSQGNTRLQGPGVFDKCHRESQSAVAGSVGVGYQRAVPILGFCM